MKGPFKIKSVKFVKITAAVFTLVIMMSFLFSGENTDMYGEVTGDLNSREMVIGFFTYNGYGNNLYIDNVRTGDQINYDIKVTSLLNLPYDTVYSVLLSGTDTIVPIVGVSNLGRLSSTDSISVYLKVDPIGYFDSVRIAPLGAGQSVATSFSQLTYPIGPGLYITAYTGFELDSNRVNDTLRQYTIVLPGYERSVMFEEFTSNSSPACANNNIFLNAFINTNFSGVCAIKYHTGDVGVDSFYIANPLQSDARKRYYYAGAVPLTIADGTSFLSIPYGDSINLYAPYLLRKSVGSPLQVEVSEEVIGTGSRRSTATIQIPNELQPGDYKLRFCVVERYRYDTLQGSNGESNFYDIFRLMLPDTNGISISSAPGTSQYSVEYNVNEDWQDSMIYTCAFIQDDLNREIINCAKSRTKTTAGGYDIANKYKGKTDPLLISGDGSRSIQGESDSIQSSLAAELFEAFFPPIGWKVFNRDGFITFKQFIGANGPSIGGVRSVIMNFYNYNIIGQRDSMYSAKFFDLFASDTVRFDYAYAQYNSTNIDSLIVRVSTDGGLTFPYEIFRRGGLALATAPQTFSEFVPQNNTEWRVYSYPLSGIVSASGSSENLPGSFELRQNYPNPFNPETKISFAFPVRANARVVVYDILGREILKLADKEFEAGVHELKFSAQNLPSGIYFCTLYSDAFTSSIRMALIK